MYAHILLAVSTNAPLSDVMTARAELCAVSKNIKCD